MVRIQLHLTPAQDRRLRALARKRGVTRAELIRRGIDRVLQDDEGEDPLLSLIGQAGPAPTIDGSEHHDRYLYGEPEEELPLPIAEDEPHPRHRR